MKNTHKNKYRFHCIEDFSAVKTWWLETTAVPEGYVDNSMENKLETADKSLDKPQK